ncbi:MAG: metallophosphoesterase [Gemmatimonadetes bacterium]|nr:metallophosphoesterase [Gemmatimonadota bacterium]
MSSPSNARVRRYASLAGTYLKRFVVSTLVLGVGLVVFGLFIGADAHLFENRLAYQLDGEVHVFHANERRVAHTVRGDNDRGFHVDTVLLPDQGDARIRVVVPADSSHFDVPIAPDAPIPASVYDDGAPIVAISDIESGFMAFRQFLVAHGIADAALNWTFGKGHLVLVGDFVDRGASTTQVLWAIYKLEQSARPAGGRVHYIIGNHEIKNLQGNYQTANEKYFHIAGILGKQQFELFDDHSVLGRWMASKNVVEVINGVAFVHGGLHPRISQLGISVEEISRIVRDGYRSPWFTPTTETTESFLRSGSTGPAWYRGYFKDDLSSQEVDEGLRAVRASAVVVGHTLQSKVNARHENKVFAIDVRHPKDYLTSFPLRRSEGLMIRDGQYFRLLQDGRVRSMRTR